MPNFAKSEPLSIPMAAARLGVKVETVYTYRSGGIFPEPDGRLIGHPYWYAETLDKWRAGRRRYSRKATS